MPNSEMDTVDETLYNRHAEVKGLEDLIIQRGTPIPTLFSSFHKFVQNPSTVSVETFKRMVDTDDTIGSSVDFLTTCLAARLGYYQHPSDEITQWMAAALDKIQGGFHNSLKEMLGATWSGFSVQEMVWGNDDQLGFIPRKLVSLPPSTIMFETERTGELTADGILQYQRNYMPSPSNFARSLLYGFSSSSTNRKYRPDPLAKLGDYEFPIRISNQWNYMALRIPIAKCIHYAFDAQGRFGNPYGRSLLRRAYKWWVMKDAFLQMLSIALDRKGTPLTIVYADPNTTMIDSSKQSKNAVQRGARGGGIRADKAAQGAFRNIHNDTTIVLPGKKGQVFDTDFVPQASNATDFMAAIDLCNKSLMRAMLVPSLIFGNGDGTGSYSLGQEHAKTFNKILDGMNSGVSQTLRLQLVERMLKLNFPESAWKKDGLGDFTKRELSVDEIEKEMAAIERAVNWGAVDMNDLSDLNNIREKIGFEARETPIERTKPSIGSEMF